MVVLPSLALTLLCLLQAGAEVPVQPGFNAEKVTAQGAHPAGPAWSGGLPGAGWGQPGTPRHPSVLGLSWHQGSCQEGVDACAKLG